MRDERPLEKLDRHRQHLGLGKRQVISQDRQFVLAFWGPEGQRRLQTAKDVVRDFECGLVIVHRDGTAEVGRRRNRDARDD